MDSIITFIYVIFNMPKFRVIVEKDQSSIDYYWMEEFKWIGWRYIHGTFSESSDMSKSKALDIIRTYNRYDINYFNALKDAPVKNLEN